jgi:hypothetical protein
MGYRSDVAYTIRFTDDHDTHNRQSFFTFLAEAKNNPKCALALQDAELDVDEKNFRINFRIENVKWYESYPDVQSHEALIELAEEWVNERISQSMDNTLGVVFVRVGEDADDIVHRGRGDYHLEWLDVSRQIICDWAQKKVE